MKRFACAVLAALLCMIGAAACSQGFDAQSAQAWIDGFAREAALLAPNNDPAMTADPARAGQMLYAYDFGTVLASGEIGAGQLMEIDIRSSQIADCRGVSVGMGLGDATGGMQVGASDTQLYVLSVEEANPGWSWAYIGESGVYGVEYVAYGGEDARMKEYTLTYVITDGVISSIRMRVSDATQAQAQQGLATTLEIKSRQGGEIYALANAGTMMAEADLCVMGVPALGESIAELIPYIGEPEEIQTLPGGKGRILVYDGMVIDLGLEEMTGEEIIRGLTVSTASVTGPRGLMAGMGVQEAAALFRCDSDVASVGGVLYLEGEAKGHPPYGELVKEAAGGQMLRYLCFAGGGVARLEAGISGAAVSYWHLYMESEEAEDAKQHGQ